MKVAVLQLNVTVGAIEENAALIIEAAKKAYAAGARLHVTSEFALSGAPALDLLLNPDFGSACEAGVKRIAAALSDYPDLFMLLGHPVIDEVGKDTKPQNIVSSAVSMLHAGRVEQRYIATQKMPFVFDVNGLCCHVLLGAEGVLNNEQDDVRDAQIVLALTANPYFLEARFEDDVVNVARKRGVLTVCAQMVGAHDEVVFAGGSFAVAASGDVLARATIFEETILHVEVDCCSRAHEHDGEEVKRELNGELFKPYPEQECLWRALVLGLRDYVHKSGFKNVVLGLSGGMDSALVLAIAVDAIGADNVSAVMMPSAYTSQISLDDASAMAKRVGVSYDVLPITPSFEALLTTLEPAFLKTAPAFENDTTQENLQARIRGVLLMAISNRTGALVLACGNKSELATGYCTLYGDMVGGFAPIKDVLKTRVYELARWRNVNNPLNTVTSPIPERIITRAPSAELRPGQTDQDNLPPYDVLDGIIRLYMEQNASIDSILNAGYKREDVEKVAKLIKMGEYKRHQAPIGTKVSVRSFGVDWQYPIVSQFKL